MRLLLASLFLLGACSSTNVTSCPPFPVAGEKVAEELETIPFEGYEDFWGWMDRVDKLKDQLSACR